ncbi:hypothetical protein OBBRIDRAFT_808790, partial [Obba rivulosa]
MARGRQAVPPRTVQTRDRNKTTHPGQVDISPPPSPRRTKQARLPKKPSQPVERDLEAEEAAIRQAEEGCSADHPPFVAQARQMQADRVDTCTADPVDMWADRADTRVDRLDFVQDPVSNEDSDESAQHEVVERVQQPSADEYIEDKDAEDGVESEGSDSEDIKKHANQSVPGCPKTSKTSKISQVKARPGRQDVIAARSQLQILAKGMGDSTEDNRAGVPEKAPLPVTKKQKTPRLPSGLIPNWKARLQPGRASPAELMRSGSVSSRSSLPSSDEMFSTTTDEDDGVRYGGLGDEDEELERAAAAQTLTWRSGTRSRSASEMGSETYLYATPAVNASAAEVQQLYLKMYPQEQGLPKDGMIDLLRTLITFRITDWCSKFGAAALNAVKAIISNNPEDLNSPELIGKYGKFQSELILRTFSTHLNILTSILASITPSDKRPVGALILSILAVERALNMWTTGECKVPPGSLGHFSIDYWNDRTEYKNGEYKSNKKASWYFKAVDSLKDQDWDDIFEGARVYCPENTDDASQRDAVAIGGSNSDDDLELVSNHGSEAGDDELRFRGFAGHERPRQPLRSPKRLEKWYSVSTVLPKWLIWFHQVQRPKAGNGEQVRKVLDVHRRCGTGAQGRKWVHEIIDAEWVIKVGDRYVPCEVHNGCVRWKMRNRCAGQETGTRGVERLGGPMQKAADGHVYPRVYSSSPVPTPVDETSTCQVMQNRDIAQVASIFCEPVANKWNK